MTNVTAQMFFVTLSKKCSNKHISSVKNTVLVKKKIFFTFLHDRRPLYRRISERSSRFNVRDFDAIHFTTMTVFSLRKNVSLILAAHLQATIIFFAEKRREISRYSLFFALFLHEKKIYRLSFSHNSDKYVLLFFFSSTISLSFSFRVGSHVVFAWIHCTDVRIHCTDILIECRKISLCFLIYTQKVIHHFPAHIFPYQTLPG